MRQATKALQRSFETKRADTGEAWTPHARTLSAYHLTASPDKSVTFAFEFAPADGENAALIQTVWRVNDDAMRYVDGEIGQGRRGYVGNDQAG